MRQNLASSTQSLPPARLLPSFLPSFLPSGSPQVASGLVFRKGKSFGSSARHCHIFLEGRKREGTSKAMEEEEEEAPTIAISIREHREGS